MRPELDKPFCGRCGNPCRHYTEPAPALDPPRLCASCVLDRRLPRRWLLRGLALMAGATPPFCVFFGEVVGYMPWDAFSVHRNCGGCSDCGELEPSVCGLFLLCFILTMAFPFAVRWVVKDVRQAREVRRLDRAESTPAVPPVLPTPSEALFGSGDRRPAS